MPASLDIDWQSVQRLHATGSYTFKQLSDIFHVPSNAIRTRASRQEWNKLRDSVTDRVSRRDTRVTNPNNGTELNERASAVADTVAEIAAKKDSFRHRVALQIEKVLTHLGDFPDPQCDRDADCRLTVLEKAERVGSRAYGLTQNAAPQVLINLGALRSLDSELLTAEEIEA
jgi:hypothetical protein